MSQAGSQPWSTANTGCSTESRDGRAAPSATRAWVRRAPVGGSKGVNPAEARAQRGALVPDEVTWTATGASRITVRGLEKLRDALVDSLAELPFGEALSTAQRNHFDAQTTRVYAAQAGLFPAEAANVEIWSYHALVLTPDLALWRWRHMEPPNIERFLGLDLTRHTFARLWWRWYTFTSGRINDVAGWALLERLGEADIDQLQSRRNAYGVDPPIVRALAEVYLEVKQRSADEGLPSRPVWRDLLKRLLRRGAFVAFGAMQPESLVAAAREQLDVSIEALRSAEGGEQPEAMSDAGWQAFDAIPLAQLVVAVTQAVEDAGVLADGAVPDAVETRLGVEVPGRFVLS